MELPLCRTVGRAIVGRAIPIVSAVRRRRPVVSSRPGSMVQWFDGLDRPLQEVQMIKLIGGITRKDGMSVEEFQSYWRDVHAPLIARTPGLRRYIQAHALPQTYEEQPPAYDGLAEAWFDSLEAFDAAVASSEWQAAVAGAPNFIGKSVRMLATELPVINAFASPAERRGMVKYAGFLKRKEGLT